MTNFSWQFHSVTFPAAHHATFHTTHETFSISIHSFLNFCVNVDVLKLGKTAGEGIIQKVPDLIPTPENLYMISKQTLIGLPFELLLSGLDKLCMYFALILSKRIECPSY